MMIGGVTKEMSDGMKIRGNINILLSRQDLASFARQPEEKAAAVAELAEDRQAAAVRIDHGFGDRKP